MKKILLLISLILGACAPKYNYYAMDPTFIEYSDRFQNTFNVENRVPIIFAEQKGNVIGSCHRYIPNSPANWIEIDPTYWGELDDLGKEELIYHELGHCVFALDHDDEFIEKDGMWIEKSIMNPYHFGSDWYYETYHQYYIDEMMSRIR